MKKTIYSLRILLSTLLVGLFGMALTAQVDVEMVWSPGAFAGEPGWEVINTNTGAVIFFASKPAEPSVLALHSTSLLVLFTKCVVLIHTATVGMVVTLALLNQVFHFFHLMVPQMLDFHLLEIHVMEFRAVLVPLVLLFLEHLKPFWLNVKLSVFQK